MQRSERDKLIEDNMNLVYFVIRKYYPTFINDEDLIQTGMIGLCKAADKFDPERGTFSTYASVLIRNEIRKEFMRRYKDNEVSVISLDVPTSNDDGEIGTLLDLIIGEQDVGFVDVETYCKSLTSTEKKYFDLLLAGYRQKDLPAITGNSKQMVSQTVRRLKAKWRLFNGN